MTAPVPSYRIKIERAKRHIRELAEEIQAFNARNPYSSVVEHDMDARQRVWKLKVNECVPVEWSAIVGDAIHNARAALDLLMVAIVRRCDPGRQSYNHVHFVIRESKNKFEAALSENIKGASPKARRLIENLKPYKGGDEAFWRLHQLDVLDKHKAIIPVGSVHHSTLMIHDPRRMFAGIPGIEDLGDIEDLLSLPPTAIQFVNGGRRPPAKNGAELFRAPLDEELPFDENIPFAFEVVFGEGQIVDGEPLVPALTQICQFVEGVFDIFETHILN